MNVTALLLADSRFPGGGHVHSGGLEEAASRGLVRTEADLPAFLRNRLRTAGALAAVFAAAAARPDPDWLLLDAELDARTPSEAQRKASRAQGRATSRAARLMSPLVDALLAATPRPHHPVILGALVGVPVDAALTAAYLAVSGPASASVRLLGLDPLRVNAIVAGLASDITSVAREAAADRHPADLPAPGSPGLDVLAEEHDRHHREEVRLFVS
ncbi:urease accessory protein UreF [Actinophytocola algeriensis]|uniref:Urease accessory protein n=1 Tax=Actinophytocola algeriensis TaxID=1768010 RepID=A0A7W7QFT8_9PSEU|nr:urease accessory UreF family protein [Actinophytocola algeriensis]MBB4912559.1 urease accessory protein [Actinophytocola algeriensis]MBE1478933.1 urease accessory protein [Actinophytocola algeriensis]